jgi:hypothetical protein
VDHVTFFIDPPSLLAEFSRAIQRGSCDVVHRTSYIEPHKCPTGLKTTLADIASRIDLSVFSPDSSRPPMSENRPPLLMLIFRQSRHQVSIPKNIRQIFMFPDKVSVARGALFRASRGLLGRWYAGGGGAFGRPSQSAWWILALYPTR